MLLFIQKKQHGLKSYCTSHYRISERNSKQKTSASSFRELFRSKNDIKLKLKRHPTFINLNRNEGGNDNDENDDIVDRISGSTEIIISVLQKPISLLGDVSFGFVIILLLILLSQPILQAGLNILFFAIFSYLGKKIIVLELKDEDLLNLDQNVVVENDQRETYPQIDFFALIFSFFIADLISPVSVRTDITLLSSNMGVSLGLLLALGLLTITYSTIQEIQNVERLNPDEKLMYRWDLKLKDDKTKGSNLKDDKKN